jgi:DNA (cytosine-5)-methyltransferase 1
MSTLINTHVSEARSVSRVWLEGEKLFHGGLEIGMRFMMNPSKDLHRVELRPAPDDYAGKTFTVSKRTRNGRTYPLIEIRDAILAEIFEIGSKIRIAIQKGRLVLTRSQVAMRVAERVKRFNDKMKSGEPLSTLSCFHGGGVLDKALHKGLANAGVSSYVKLAVEMESEYIDSSLRNNPELWREDSTVVTGDIRELNVMGASIPQCDLAWGGVPCSGASKSGASKLQLSCAEEHEGAGSMFYYFLDLVRAMNPAICLIENVKEYLNTASMTVIRQVLTALGYELSIKVVSGFEMGSLEKRDRMCLVATTPGACLPVDFDQLKPIREREAQLSDVLEDVPESSESWKPYSYLADKEVRDKKAGKGFARQLLTGEEDGCGVIGRGYAKARSTEPFIVAKHNPALSRLLTVREHARVKTIPESMVEGLSDTKAHEVLGQSVIFTVFEAVGELIGRTIRGLSAPSKPAENFDQPGMRQLSMTA